MSKINFWKLLLTISLITLAAGGLTQSAAATTYNTINVDCDISDFAGDENMGAGGMGAGQNLYVTWDATNLYVGVSSPNGVIVVNIDTASGGTSTASAGGTHQIAVAPKGYEYSYAVNAPGTFSQYEVGTSGSWAVQGMPIGTQVCAGSGPDTEWGIPWTDIGVPPGTQLTILVTDRTAGDNITEYWPAAPGNSNPAPSFTQGFVFNSAATSGVSPAGSPTAVTLQSITANSNTAILPILIAALLLALMGGAALRRRSG